MRRLAALSAAASAALAWGWFEAGWVRLRVLRCPVAGLPPELDGLRIAHLSDFHLGVPSRGKHAVIRAVDWVEERRPDLVCVTGDLLTRPRGAELLRALLDRLENVYAVLGNHDFGIAKDPLARSSAPLDAGRATVLLDDAASVQVRGRRVQLVGVDARSYVGKRARPADLGDADADLRLLLCHFPRIVDRMPADAFHLVLAGHVHDGQIAIPYGRGKVRLGELRPRYTRGIYVKGSTTLHVSPGLGTTFVPFRFAARPEATELVLVNANERRRTC